MDSVHLAILDIKSATHWTIHQQLSQYHKKTMLMGNIFCSLFVYLFIYIFI